MELLECIAKKGSNWKKKNFLVGLQGKCVANCTRGVKSLQPLSHLAEKIDLMCCLLSLLFKKSKHVGDGNFLACLYPGSIDLFILWLILLQMLSGRGCQIVLTDLTPLC